MKKLISTGTLTSTSSSINKINFVAIGLGGRVFLTINPSSDAIANNTTTYELVAPEGLEPTDATRHHNATKAKIKAMEEEDEAQGSSSLPAVCALCATQFSTDSAVIVIAVTNVNKAMFIYHCDVSGSAELTPTSPTPISPTATWLLPKKSAALTFVPFSSLGGIDENTSNNTDTTNTTTIATSPPVLIVGDKVGDVKAYPTPKLNEIGFHPSCRHLLGHTASIITSICHMKMDDKYLLITSDRDEKVRVSEFPKSFITRNFFMGHTTFITSVSVSGKAGLIVSAGADKKIMLWDAVKGGDAVATFSLGEALVEGDSNTVGVPSSIAISDDGKHIAYIVDGASDISLMTVEGGRESGEGNGYSLKVVGSLPILRKNEAGESALPLNIEFLGESNRLYAVCTEPSYLMAFDVEKGGRVIDDCSFCAQFNEELKKLALEKMVRSTVEAEKEETGSAGLGKRVNKLEHVVPIKKRNSKNKKQRQEGKAEGGGGGGAGEGEGEEEEGKKGGDEGERWGGDDDEAAYYN